jgi:hypothetical protein
MLLLAVRGVVIGEAVWRSLQNPYSNPLPSVSTLCGRHGLHSVIGISVISANPCPMALNKMRLDPKWKKARGEWRWLVMHAFTQPNCYANSIFFSRGSGLTRPLSQAWAHANLLSAGEHGARRLLLLVLLLLHGICRGLEDTALIECSRMQAVNQAASNYKCFALVANNLKPSTMCVDRTKATFFMLRLRCITFVLVH